MLGGWHVEAVSRGLLKRKRTFAQPDIILPDEYPHGLVLRGRIVFPPCPGVWWDGASS